MSAAAWQDVYTFDTEVVLHAYCSIYSHRSTSCSRGELVVILKTILLHGLDFLLLCFVKQTELSCITHSWRVSAIWRNLPPPRASCNDCFYTVSQKKRHWCCRLYLQRTSTDFNSFWQVIASVFELSYVHLIFHVRLLLLPYFAASLRRRKWRILTSLVVCKHAVY